MDDNLITLGERRAAVPEFSATNDLDVPLEAIESARLELARRAMDGELDHELTRATTLGRPRYAPGDGKRMLIEAMRERWPTPPRERSAPSPDVAHAFQRAACATEDVLKEIDRLQQVEEGYVRRFGSIVVHGGAWGMR